MRKMIVLFATLLLAGPASAKVMQWVGTGNYELFGGSATSIDMYGSGVATVNGSAGGAHLSTLRLPGGLSGSAVIPLTDPEGTITVKSIIVESVGIASGTLTGISGAPPLGQGKLPVPGHARVCLFVENCEANLPVDLTKNNGNTGVGVAGFVTLGGLGSIRISIQGAPFTLGPASLVHRTLKGNFETRTRVGFIHGPGSAASSTAVTSGVIQLIAPEQVAVTGLAGNSTAQALFTTITLRFIPEPGLLLLLGSGVVGLGLLGRGRMKR
jgi:hypothetical protein